MGQGEPGGQTLNLSMLGNGTGPLHGEGVTNGGALRRVQAGQRADRDSWRNVE